MKLFAPGFDDFSETRLREGDPLPPEDRAPIEPALDALYRIHARRLQRFFARHTGLIDADDLVQETFARAAGAYPSPNRRIESAAAYLTKIAVNLLRDRARAATRQGLAGPVSYDEELHGEIDPHRTLDERDALARLDAAIGRLNRRTRKIFLLHRVDGLTYVEIAGTMGMSVKGVKKQMAKALIQLRRDVGPL